MTTLNTRIRMKRDTNKNWTSANPVLMNGEIIIVDTDSGEARIKIGDGKKAYGSLPFYDETAGKIATLDEVRQYIGIS